MSARYRTWNIIDAWDKADSDYMGSVWGVAEGEADERIFDDGDKRGGFAGIL
jgi:hypothetical protein